MTRRWIPSPGAWHHGRAAILVLMVGAFTSLTFPPTASACIGGMDFAWAVGQAQGGIVEGRVVEAVAEPGHGLRVRLDDITRVLGDPPLTARASLTMGDVCYQSADPGETVWLLYGMERLDIPKGLTLAFVVEGPDGVGREAARAALAALPATDVAPSASQARPIPFAGLSLLVVWLASFLAVFTSLPGGVVDRKGPGRPTSARRGRGPRGGGGRRASGGG